MKKFKYTLEQTRLYEKDIIIEAETEEEADKQVDQLIEEMNEDPDLDLIQESDNVYDSKPEIQQGPQEVKG